MIQIKVENSVELLVEILNQIPEFSGQFNKAQLADRLKSDPIVLMAYFVGTPAGCKVGYDRYSDGSYYSWLGGVLPRFRKKGIAEQLNKEMEILVKKRGYTSIILKTRNKFKGMLRLALKNGYDVVGFERKENSAENRIILKKDL